MQPEEQTLAVAVVRDAVNCLQKEHPPKKRPTGTKLDVWRTWWRNWARDRERDRAFFSDPKLSAFWCEAAGVSWDAIVSRLYDQELMYPASDHYPRKLAERSIALTEAKRKKRRL